MSVTSSVFFAEGGVSGTIKPPPRGQRRITPRVGPGGATGSVHGEITVPQPKTPLAPTTLPDKPAATPTTTTPKASAPTTAPAAPKSGSLTTGKVTVDYNLSSFDPKSAIKLKNIDLSDYPPEKKGPVSRFFNDRPVLAKFSSIAASQAINYANDKALELIESHFASALEDARKEFATRFPSRNSLFSSADINGRRKAYESAIAKLDRPRRLRIAAQVFVVLTTPDNKLDAAMRQVEQSLAGLGITADDVMNYLDAAFAYESVMIDLYEQVGRYSGELATLSIDVDLHLRAEVLWRCANDLDKSARSVAQLPFVAFAPGEQLVLTLWKLRDTFQGLGDGMDSFAWEIPARASEYDRLLKSLSSQLIRIGDQLDMWGTTYDTNKKRNTSTTRSRK